MGVRVTQDLVIIRNGRLVVDGIDPGHGFQIDGSIISNTGALAELPAGLHVDGSLVLTGASIETIPPSVSVTGWIDLLNCKALKTISDDLEVHVHLQINGCDSLKPLPDLRHVQCILHGRYSAWPSKKQIHVEGLAIDSEEKSKWLGKTFNDLIGVELFEEMSIAKLPILIIREQLSARGQHTEFTIGD